jgi:cytochrome bd-type quinol oxidase subunit 2
MDEIIYSSLNMFFSLLGVIFLILVIYGGAKWMTSRGNQEEIKKAKNILISSIIGLLIVLVAYALTWFIFNFFITTKLTIKK